MKRLYKALFIFIIAVYIIPINIVTAINKENIVIGNENDFIDNGDEFVLIDIDGLMPGDYIEDIVVIKNESNKSFNLKANIEELANNEEKYYLLDKLNVYITCGDLEIFKGKASDIDKFNKSYVNLGDINKGEEKILQVIAELDGRSVSNEFQNKQGAFKINFFIGENYEKVNESDKKPSWLPNTGGQNVIYVLILAIGIVLVGYKLIKKR